MSRRIPLLLLLAVLAAGCSQQKTTYTHPEQGWSITLPAGWEATRTNQAGVSLVLIEPVETDELMPPSIRVMSGPVTEQAMDMPLSIQARTLIGQLAAASDSFAVLDSAQVRFAGREAIRYRFLRRFDTPQFGSIRRMNEDTFFRSDSLLLMLAFAATESSWERYQPLFAETGASLELPGDPERR